MINLKRILKYKVIAPDCPEGQRSVPLMTRYIVFRAKAMSIYLHHFHRSDVDDFHDHPWAFITFLFQSGYWEHLPHPTRRVWRRRFSILYRTAEFQHYVEVVKPTWTLVIRFREVREWGFIINNKWVPWRKAANDASRSLCKED